MLASCSPRRCHMHVSVPTAALASPFNWTAACFRLFSIFQDNVAYKEEQVANRLAQAERENATVYLQVRAGRIHLMDCW